MNLKGKVLIVTGASEGLGRAITEKLLDKGALVHCISRKGRVNSPEGSTGYSADVTDYNSLKEAIKEISKKEKRIDGLINSAGIWHKTKPLEEITPQEIEAVLNTNLMGLIYATNIALPFLKKSEEAVIVNISSKSGTRPMDLQTVYCASKYGVKGFTDTLKLELKKSNIKVLGFYPSGMNTKMFEKTGEEFTADTFMDVKKIAEIICFALEQSSGNISIEEIQIEKY